MPKIDQTTKQVNADYLARLCHVNEQVRELDARVSDAVELVLKTFMSPAAFYALQAFHHDIDRAEGHIGMSFLEALDSLGCRHGVEEFERTLGRLKTNQDFL